MAAAAIAARVGVLRSTPRRSAKMAALAFDEPGGPLVAVCGLAGGAGTSTLALTLARHAAAVSTGPRARGRGRPHQRRPHGDRRAGVEDLYPDVDMDGSRGGPTWGQSVVRLKKRRPFVLSIQTNRNYEHAFAESLVALLSAHDHETTVQLVLTPAAGWIDRRARRLLKRRERVLQHADHRDPGDLGIDSVVRGQGVEGRARAAAPIACVLRPARDRARRHDREARSGTLLAAEVRERVRVAAHEPAPQPVCTADRAGAAEPDSELAHRGDVDVGARDALAAPPRASNTRGCRGRPSGARSLRLKWSETPPACSCTTSEGPSRSRRRIGSTAMP